MSSTDAMSEHKGPWQRSNGNTVLTGAAHPYAEREPLTGLCINTHDALPSDCVPLVPLSEVDAVKAELAEAKAGLDKRLDWACDLPEAPSLPVHGTPEALRIAREEVDTLWQVGDSVSFARSIDSVLNRLREKEAAQLREATHTAAIEKAAKVMADVNAEPYGWDELIEAERDDYRMNARALAEAGLLVDGASE